MDNFDDQIVINFVRRKLENLLQYSNETPTALSRAMGKNDNYIANILNKKSSMTLEAIAVVLYHYNIQIKDFFDDVVPEQPYQYKELYNDLSTLTDGDIEGIHKIVKTMTPQEYQAMLQFLNDYKNC